MVTEQPRNAVVVIEADKRNPVIWTKPEDLDFGRTSANGLIRRHGDDSYLSEVGQPWRHCSTTGASVLFFPTQSRSFFELRFLSGDGEDARVDLPWYSVIRPRCAAHDGFVGGSSVRLPSARAINCGRLMGGRTSQGEILWLIVGCAVLAHAVAVLSMERGYHLLPAPHEDWQLQIWFWLPPAAISAFVCLVGVTWSRFPGPWRILFAVSVVLFGLDALDATSPDHRSLEDSFVSAFPPIFTGALVSSPVG